MMDEDEGRGSTDPSRGRLRRLALDLSPFRYRDYRLLWFGEVVSKTGHQITLVAVYVQIYDLTRSAAAVGLVGVVQLIPLILTSLFGSPLVDAHDRRRLLFATEIGLVFASSLLLLGASMERPPLWLVYGAAGLGAGLGGLETPTRTALIPMIVGREKLSSAITLHQILWNTTMIVGPAIAGLIIARLGLVWAYGIDVATYGATIVSVALMRPAPPVVDGVSPATGVPGVLEGLSFLRRHRVLQATFLADMVAMVLGNPRALFPVLAVVQFHRGAEAVGLLFSALAVGALLGALTAGWVRHVDRQGRAVLVAVAAWGAGIIGFGLTGDRFVLALTFLALAGGADVVSAVLRGTILQQGIPDSIRGRMSGVHSLVVQGGPRLGDLRAGVLATALGATASVVSGGIAVLVGVALMALFAPRFVGYRRGDPP